MAFQFCSRIQDILKYMYEACFPRKRNCFLSSIVTRGYLKCLKILTRIFLCFIFSIMGDLSWKDFLSQAKQFLEISQKLGDNWILEQKVSRSADFIIRANYLIRFPSQLRTRMNQTPISNVVRRLNAEVARTTRLSWLVWSTMWSSVFPIKYQCCSSRRTDQVFTYFTKSH